MALICETMIARLISGWGFRPVLQGCRRPPNPLPAPQRPRGRTIGKLIDSIDWVSNCIDRLMLVSCGTLLVLCSTNFVLV